MTKECPKGIDGPPHALFMSRKKNPVNDAVIPCSLNEPDILHTLAPRNHNRCRIKPSGNLQNVAYDMKFFISAHFFWIILL